MGVFYILDLPIEIFLKQWDLMKQQNLLDLFDLEMKIQRISREMTARGVRIDTGKLPVMMQEYEDRIKKLQRWISNFAGFEYNSNRSVHTREVFDKHGWEYPFGKPTNRMLEKDENATGNPSFSAKYVIKPMAEAGNEFCANLIKLKVAKKTLGTFLTGGIYENLVDGRIHGQFNPLKSTDESGSGKGAVTGRFSSSHPNLQNLPAKDILSKLVRELFIPEENHYWCKADYKQVEVRVLGHFAMGTGAEQNRRNFQADPEYDYHQWCSDMTGIERKFAKNLNFGIMYGMGVKRMVKDR